MTYRARSRLLGWLIVRSVPVLNAFRRGYPWRTRFSELIDYPQDSWGRHVHAFLAARGMEFLPKYEPHDALHVECRDVMKSDFSRGKTSSPIDWLSIEGAMHMPLELPRNLWRISDIASTA